MKKNIFTIFMALITILFLSSASNQSGTITFNKNDAGATGSMSTQCIASGSSVNLKANRFFKKGWIFAGWSTTETGPVEYTNKVSYTMGSSNVILYAKWTPPDVFSLKDKGPAGGWIFYDKGSYTDGWRYLECAPADLKNCKWGTWHFTVTGADGTAIGTGKQNILNIIASDTGTSNKAADECANYIVTSGGTTYDDWYLPSKDELNLMFINLKVQGIGVFAEAIYWSSSENSADYAWVQGYDDGIRAFDSKGSIKRIRAIRAF